MSSKNIFVVIEGLSGVGKTSICQKIIEGRNFKYLKTPLPPFDKFNDLVRSTYLPESKFLYYISHAIETQKCIQNLLLNKSIIMDRYYYTTVVYAKAMNPKIYLPSFVNIFEPDFKFLISASNQIREDRLYNKNGKYPNLDLEKESQIMQYYNEFNFHIINNEGDIYDSTNHILNIIEENLTGRV